MKPRVQQHWKLGTTLWLAGVIVMLVVCTLVGSLPLPLEASARPTATAEGRLVGLTFAPGMGTSGSLVAVNSTTGAFTTIAPVPSFSLTSGIVALGPAARRLYVQRSDFDTGTVSLRGFNTQTGGFTDAPLTQQLLALAYEAAPESEPVQPRLYLPLLRR